MAQQSEFDFIQQQNAQAKRHVDMLRELSKPDRALALTFPEKEMHGDRLYVPGGYNGDRETWILNAVEVPGPLPGRHIRTPIQPFPEPLAQFQPDSETQARQQEKRLPSDQRVPRYDVVNAQPHLEPASTFGNARTLGIRLGQLQAPFKPDIPIWSRNDPFDI